MDQFVSPSDEIPSSCPAEKIWPGVSLPAGMKLWRSAAGFTLFEVITVLLLLGILAGVGVPALNSALSDVQLSALAGEVEIALEFAQVFAISSGGTTRVTLDSDTDTLLVEHSVPFGDLLEVLSELPEKDVEDMSFSPLGYPLKRGTEYRIDLANEGRFGDAGLATVDFSSSNFVTFDAWGKPSAGGTVTLTRGKAVTIVTLDPLTGRVTRSDEDR